MVSSTHLLTIERDRVVKRYRSAEQGEPDHEWRCLEFLSHHAPDLAPHPIEQRVHDGQVELVMTRLPGEPLGDRSMEAGQVRALAAAITALHGFAPAALHELPERNLPWTQMCTRVADWLPAAECPPDSIQLAQVLSSAKSWLETAHSDPSHRLVLGNGDGNLGNYLWDGERCRIVDFEDGGTSTLAYEVADLVEHVSTAHTAELTAERLLDLLDLSEPERQEIHECRRLFAVFWLLMLLPGNPAYDRNPAGTADRQAVRLLDLLESPHRP